MRFPPTLGLAAAVLAACGARTGFELGAGAPFDAGAPAVDAVPAEAAVLDSAGPTEASLSDVAPPPEPADVGCPHAPGVQANAPWPLSRRCPGGAASSPVIGPLALPKVAWRTPTVQRARSLSDLVIAADATLYVTDSDGVIALDSSGAIRWKSPIEYGTPPRLAVAADGTVLAAHGGGVTAFRPDGSILWTRLACALGVDLATDGTIYTVAGCNPAPSLLALTASGSTQWQIPAGVGVSSPPVLGADGTIYLFDQASAQSTALTAFHASSAQAWQVGSGGQAILGRDGLREPPVVADDGTIVFEDTLGVHSVDASGKSRWTVPAKSFGPLAVGADGTVFTQNSPGFAAVRNDGSVAWRWGDMMHDLYMPIVGGDHTVYAVGGGDQLDTTYAISATGELLWTSSTAGVPKALGADGTLYTIDASGTVTALRP